MHKVCPVSFRPEWSNSIQYCKLILGSSHTLDNLFKAHRHRPLIRVPFSLALFRRPNQLNRACVKLRRLKTKIHFSTLFGESGEQSHPSPLQVFTDRLAFISKWVEKPFVHVEVSRLRRWIAVSPSRPKFKLRDHWSLYTAVSTKVVPQNLSMRHNADW